MNIKERLARYEELVNLSGIAANEKEVRLFMEKSLREYTSDILKDKLGGVFGCHVGDQNGPVIMIAGHMDEVGAMVTGITEKGFIKMIPIGGIMTEVMVSQNMEIVINENKKIKGIVGAIPPHMFRGTQAKKVEFDDLLLDIGADSKEDAINMGVKLGQQIVFVNNYYITEDGKKAVSKAWDDRFGCGMALDIMEEVVKMNHPNIVICGGTVQEEVGLRGATVASQMVKPDFFIAVDVSPVGDFLPSSNPRSIGTLGKGFLVRFYDPRCIMNPVITKYFENLCDKENIPSQMFLSMGGTDAASAQYAGNGTLSTTIGLPGRYIHSTSAMIHIDDVEAVKKMLLAIIKDFDRNRLEELLKG